MYFVVRSFQVNTEMVESNYYEKELEYEKLMKAGSNFNAVQNTLYTTLEGTTVNIRLDTTLSRSLENGTAQFYFAANSKNDRTFPIGKSDDGNYSFDRKNLAKGKNTLKLSFESNGKSYYREETVFIP